MRILEILFLVLSAMLYNDCIVTCEREISAVDWAALSVSGLLSSLAAGQGGGDVGSGKTKFYFSTFSPMLLFLFL